MKKIVYLLLTTAAICFCSCGGKSAGDSEAASNKETLKPMLNIETPADPTGNLEQDAKVLADYMAVMMPLVEEVTGKLELYITQYKDNSEFDAVMIATADEFNKNSDDNPDYRDLTQLGAPTGDAKKDAEVYAVAQLKALAMGNDYTAVLDKYTEYYAAKGDEETMKFEEAIMKALPEEIKNKIGD